MSPTTQYSLNPAKFTADKINFFLRNLTSHLVPKFLLEGKFESSYILQVPSETVGVEFVCFFLSPDKF